ncbi:AMP-binding protein [Acanthopleuribacter pedis]|uniref:AMP-binding protein n=1 Tax=Acanthopleuribacter pedis TaxID=442870 RepID=A0A8J7Q8J6_9BACT|nr:AMP-binding protein [Acanthopleuribacter pedis]MBO1318874.1 AMP-binding protein [Acanthopleuribacter pedis]
MTSSRVPALTEAGLSPDQAASWQHRLDVVTNAADAALLWQAWLSFAALENLPFTAHAAMFAALQSFYPASEGPFPVWQPQPSDLERAHITRHIRRLGLADYAAFHQWSVTERETFWRDMIDDLGIIWREPFSTVLHPAGNVAEPHWFPNGRLNIADSCFQAAPDSPAIVFQRAGSNQCEQWTVSQLKRLASRVANGLVDAGFEPGDAVAVNMAMTPESVAIYLGIVKAGCVVVSIADSFSPAEIATRLRISNAKGIFTTDVNPRGTKRMPMYAKVKDAEAPTAVVLPGTSDPMEPAELRGGDLLWENFLSDNEHFASVARDALDPANILFSSGTTGDPKAIPWNQLTPIKCGVDGMLHHDIHAGDVVCWPTNLGWMMGPWLIFASLLNRATIALYCDAPTSAEFCKFVERAGVTMLGVIPSIVKAWRQSDAVADADWSGIQTYSSTGECSNVDDMFWLMAAADFKPVIEYCGGTEIGGGYVTGTRVQNASPATFSTPALGLDLILLDEEHHPQDTGEVFLLPPSIGLSLSLLNKDHFAVYYGDTPLGPKGEILRRHGDQLQRIGGGYYRALGRADDTMNLGGIKVSSAEIERTLNGLPGVNETAAIAVPPSGGGPSMLVVFAVLAESLDHDTLARDMQKAIRAKLNPLFKISALRVVNSLPRTASGKVMRRMLRAGFTP